MTHQADPLDGNPQSDDALHRDLARALPPPVLPAGFIESLHAAVERDAVADLAQRRRDLEREHERLREEMQAGYVRLRRDTLAIALVVAFVAGLCATLALPWLASVAGANAAALAPWLAVVVGFGVGAQVWIERRGWPRWR